MSALPPTDRPLTAGEYVLMKHGLFYRPNAAGYTGIRDNAGIYSADDAAQHADPISGVTALALADAPEFAPNCFDDIARDHLLKKLNDLRATNARPATSAASEGEGVTLAHRVYRHLTNYAEICSARRENIESVRDMAFSALASPPVSEREMEMEGALREAVEFIDALGAELLNERTADWYPEGANNAASHMSEAMRLAGNRCADYQALTAQPAGEGK